MVHVRKYLVLAAVAIAAAWALPAAAQSYPAWQNRHDWGWQDRDRDRDHDRDRDRDRDRNDQGRYAYGNAQNTAYQEGYRAGRADRQANRPGSQFNHKRYRDANLQQAFDNGYNAGYNAGYGNQGPWNGEHRRRGGWGNGGYGGYGQGGNQAAQLGYQDGMNAAQADLQRGNGYHPHDGNNYRNGDRGYNSSFGDKRQYITEYRNAYQQGYDRVYYGNSGRR